MKLLLMLPSMVFAVDNNYSSRLVLDVANLLSHTQMMAVVEGFSEGNKIYSH